MKAEHGNLKHIVIDGEPYLVEETVFNFTMCLSRENAALKSRRDQAIRDAVAEEKEACARVADTLRRTKVAELIRARKP